MSPEKRQLGWYLHNVLHSDLCDRLSGAVNRFMPWLHGLDVLPDRSSHRPGRHRADETSADDLPAPVEALRAQAVAFATKPAASTDAVETNALHAASVLGLTPLDLDLLLLAIRGDAGGPMENFLDTAWQRVRDLPRLAAALLGVAPAEMRTRLEKSAPLRACGLIEYDPEPCGGFSGAMGLLHSISKVMREPHGSATSWATGVLGSPARTTLRWSDFAHVRDAAAMAARLLRRAAHTGEAGVHVLLVGPPGTGKTELARALAARARLRLFATGEANDDDDEPSRSERFGALRLTGCLLRRARDAAVLLDEAEDVLEAPRSFGNRRDSYSKAFLHRTLETMPVPVLWTCNDMGQMDPATLRRMTMVIAVPVPDAAVRARIWTRVLARERLRLPADAPARLAHGWDASAGVAAGAARAARLTGGGEAALTRALRGVMGALGGTETPPETTRAFDLDLVACSQDLAVLCDRLAQPGAARAWSLCLSGPPGTGKSEFARYLAGRLGLPVLQKRGSDLLSMFVGGSEKMIAGAFREAQQAGALLLIDEAEAMLFDRGAAVRGWEVSQVAEMLTWMERHTLPFVCTTNMPDRMDAAVPHRFTLKLRFDTLDAPRAALAFRRLLGGVPPGPVPAGLTLGDFAVARRKAELFGNADPAILLDWLHEEADAKAGGRSEIGFRVRPREPEPEMQPVAQPLPFPRAA